MIKNSLIGIFILLNIALVFSLKKQHKASSTQQVLLAKQVAQNNSQQDFENTIEHKYWWELSSNAQQLPDLQLKSDLTEDQKDSSLKDLIGNEEKLVLRYSELHCDVCVDKTINQLKGFAQEVGKDKVLLLSSYKNPRDMYTFKRLNQLDLPLYNLGEQALNLKAEESSKPYLFILGPDQKAEMVFLSSKEQPELLSRYLNIIKTKYFQS